MFKDVDKSDRKENPFFQRFSAAIHPTENCGKSKNHSSETNLIINKDDSRKSILDYTNNRKGKYFLKNKRCSNFSQKTLRCFSNFTESFTTCSSINKTFFFSRKEIQNLPLAERLKHFIPSWKIVTSDLEIFENVEGYNISPIEFPRP